MNQKQVRLYLSNECRDIVEKAMEELNLTFNEAVNAVIINNDATTAQGYNNETTRT